MAGFLENLKADAVSAPELRFWAEIAVFAKDVEWKPRNVGRPRDYQARNVAATLARAYHNLTGKEPGTSKRTDNGGPFWGFLDEIFAILKIRVCSKTSGIPRSTTSRAARAASKLRGRA